MPRVADIPFPVIDVDEAAEIAERVVKEFRGTISISGLARALNMAERGGGFLKKAAALRDYGLLDGRGDLRATDLAQRIAYPSTPDEKTRALREAFLQVELFSRLADRLGTAVPEEDRFGIFVEEITRASRMEVARRIVRLRRIYAEGAKYLAGESTPGRPDQPEPPISQGPSQSPPSAAEKGIIELRTSDMQLRLPLTTASIELLISALNSLKTSLASAASVEKDGNGGVELT